MVDGSGMEDFNAVRPRVNADGVWAEYGTTAPRREDLRDEEERRDERGS